MNKKINFETSLIHAGSDPKNQQGAINPPVYRASTVIFPTVKAMRDAEKIKFDTTYYGVLGTPTTFALEDAMIEIEGGYRAVSVSSGLAAITTALITFLKSGDHLLMVDSVYGPTRNFCNTTLKKFGIDARSMINPVHEAYHFKKYFKNKDFKNSIHVSKNSLHLPSSTNLNRKQIKFICNKLIKFFNN